MSRSRRPRLVASHIRSPRHPGRDYPGAMTTTATGVRVVEVTGPGTPEFDAYLTVRQADDADLAPGDPVTPAEELAAELFLTPPHVTAQAWVAIRDGEPVGGALREQHIDGVNDAAMALYVMTRPDHRRRGVALALARTGLDGLAAAGATSVIGWAAAEPGAALCRRLGLTHRQDERESRLRIDDVDPEQQRRWIDEAPARTASRAGSASAPTSGSSRWPPRWRR
jgi:GNAT superfamily N-acetyltransferase